MSRHPPYQICRCTKVHQILVEYQICRCTKDTPVDTAKNSVRQREPEISPHREGMGSVITWVTGLTVMFVAIMGPQPGKPIEGLFWESPCLRSLGMATPPAYSALVSTARNAISQAARASPVRDRKEKRLPRRMRSSADGGPFVKDQKLRLCQEPSDKKLHTLESRKIGHPVPSSRYELTPDCIAAVQTMASASGSDLAIWRKSQIRVLTKVAAKARHFSHAIREKHMDVPPSVKLLGQGINIAFVAVLCDAIQWPDVDLCREITRDFAQQVTYEHKTATYFDLPSTPTKSSAHTGRQRHLLRRTTRSESTRKWKPNYQKVSVASAWRHCRK